MGTLDGQVALVTGGSKGIGLAVVETLARAGAKVVSMARGKEDLTRSVEALAREGLVVIGQPGDVGQEDDVRRAVDLAVAKFGGLSIVVNNAGIGVFKPVTELTPQEFDRMWGTNVRGVFLVSRAAFPLLAAHGGGHIVNIGSLAGKNTFKGGAGYCATKWALRGFSGSLMLEVRDKNIRVTTIFPGSVETAFSKTGKRGAHIPQAGDVASAVLFAVSAPGRAMFSEIDLRPTNP
jgi:NAD(P)-dependent dehydrogenase (short-subunit alcohol dehydrogenase family)